MAQEPSCAAHDISYHPPKGQVLLLSCMDPRLLDEIVRFMDHDNLRNRYDHVVFAGAALGALGAPGATDENGNLADFSYWKDVFFDQLGAAIRLHNVEHIYIVEHRNCGAYDKVFHVCQGFDNSREQRREERKLHLKYARQLEQEIKSWSKGKAKLTVHKFLMELRGNVRVLGKRRKR